MFKKHDLRAEETKKAILEAAGKLFAAHGFESVTIREIAKEAGCSHTTIYLYFKDKEGLLHDLSMPALNQLERQFETILSEEKLSLEEKLRGLSREFIRFCLLKRNMFTILFTERAGRVDEAEPELDINRTRNKLFASMMAALQGCLELQQHDNRLLTFSRIYYFALYGIVGTYAHSEESYEQLRERLGSTFDDMVDVLLAGFKKKLNREEGTI
ncbi:TetR/AcrR family transcriptional regulator [Siminovitchia sp. FSL H7-0308]|jgi:AcrR family transcriptional regulator|uniref:AcrR family transcriptional regulator n=1 Tax=Siminovitchia thermophila TaxID=1245522 RepID=A0ABS2R5H9_9BACI|nr:TetR/AcrR family transcriptional regulator [Siminovitchia thermophila]MBM7714163.1 AcrR family transcriptional regulator [Siminovitchia thermophila]ONK24753.1 TetR family transcriptional regulator [Bacillus sp. VT-16-64]